MTLQRGIWYPLGKHRYRFEDPDIFHVDCDLVTSTAEITREFEFVKELAAEVGRPVFWMSNIAKAQQMPPGARRVATETDMTPYLRGIAMFNGGFRERLFANMAIKAARLLKPNRKALDALFCETEAEARAFFEMLRRREGW
jgi:hypothetical protein